MHVAFIPYGDKVWVDLFLRDIQAQKFYITLYDEDGKEKAKQLLSAQLRVMPGGIYEIVFPKEHRDLVLTTLGFHEKQGYNIPSMYMNLVRRMFKYKDPTKFDTSKKLPWLKNFVSIIPVGTRDDDEIIETEGEFKGLRHEAL